MTFVQTIIDHLEKNSNEIAMHETHNDQLVSFSKKQFLDLFRQAQSELTLLGITKDSRVVLLGSNSAKWIACDLAIISLGAVTVPLYNRQDPKELAFMANDSQPSLFIYSDVDLKNAVVQYWDSICPNVSLDELFSPELRTVAPIQHQDTDPVTIIYTSGTSGHPKGVVLNISNVDFMLERTTNQLYSAKKNKNNNDRVFHFLPLCFAGSRMMLWTQLYRGNIVYVSTDLKNLVGEMSIAAPEFYLNVPAILERIRTGVETKIIEKGGLILKLYRKAIQIGQSRYRSFAEKIEFFVLSKFILSSIRKKIGKNLKFLICGSAALHPDTQKWFELLGIRVLQVYGLTETTAIITMDQANDVQTGFVGKVIDGVEIKTSAEGELLCRGPNVFPGYWQRPKESIECFVDGWFKTGDLAEISPSGHIKIMGRTKNVIIPSSGHNIIPEPIEELLQKTCAKIDHAVLVGHGKPYLGIIITGNITEPEIKGAIESVNETVPHYRKIKSYVHYKDGFTVENGLLTVNQKIKRNAVEKLLLPQINKMYAQVQP